MTALRLAVLVCACLALAADDPEPDGAGAVTPKALLGKWKTVKVARMGKVIAEKTGVLVIDKDTMTMKENGRDDPAGYTLDVKSKPAALDLSPKGIPQTIKGICRFHKGKLEICIADGPDKPRPTSFDGPTANVITLERIK